MKKYFLLLVGLLTLSACASPAPIAHSTAVPTPDQANIIQPTQTPIETLVPTLTAAPTNPSPTESISPGALDRPVFLAWPLPSWESPARIAQYPNTPWTWNYLGLNPGYECPPQFGYLANADSLAYWRDKSIPLEQDQAQADPHSFQMVACYSTGGPGDPAGHEGTDIKAPAGTPVYAAADGRVVEWSLTGVNSMIELKHCLGGSWDAGGQCSGGTQWYTTTMHINPDKSLLHENQEIPQGTQLGAIYDQSDNSHLHFEVGKNYRSYANFVNPWGEDHTPWLRCMWLDPSFCADPGPDHKFIAFQTPEGKLLLQQGYGVPAAVRSDEHIQQVRLWGERFAVIDVLGHLLVWDGQSPGPAKRSDLSTWPRLAENAMEVQVSSRRVAMLDKDRSLWVKDKRWDGLWSFQAQNVRAFSLSDHRIGILKNNADLLIKEGKMDNSWTPIANGVVTFQVLDNRVAYIDRQGDLLANEGELLAEYKLMASSVAAFQLTNTRLGIIDRQNRLLVKAESEKANWALVAENVLSFQMADDRILMQSKDGAFKLKEGTIYQDWTDLAQAGAGGVVLNGPMPVIVPSQSN